MSKGMDNHHQVRPQENIGNPIWPISRYSLTHTQHPRIEDYANCIPSSTDGFFRGILVLVRNLVLQHAQRVGRVSNNFPVNYWDASQMSTSVCKNLIHVYLFKKGWKTKRILMSYIIDFQLISCEPQLEAQESKPSCPSSCWELGVAASPRICMHDSPNISKYNTFWEFKS